MSTHIADVVVHVSRPHQDTNWQAMQNALRGLTGVTHVQPSDRHPGLVLVAYDPEVISAQAILNGVEHFGERARLIGM